MENKQPIDNIQDSQKKEWYKNWWGIVIVLFIWPYFLLWFMWAKLNWNKWIKAVITIVAVFGSISYVSMRNSGNDSILSEKQPPISQNEIEKLKSSIDKSLTFNTVASNPEAYKGKIIQWGAKVFTQPEKDKNGIYFQAYEGGEDNNFAISYANSNFQVRDDDFVIVTGKITGKFKGENAFGAKLEVPTVEAEYVEIVSRNDVIAPTENEVFVNQSNTQHGFTVTLNKIELAKNETRLFFKLKNEGKEKVNFYTYGSKITQGTKQYEKESSYGAGQELPSEVLPGVEAEGMVIFPAIENTPKKLTIHLDDPSNGNYSINWNTIKFDVMLP